MEKCDVKYRASIAILWLFLVSQSAAAQRVVFVDQSATGTSTGLSWSDAFVHLQDALASAQTGDEFWIAAGTYHPDQGVDVSSGDRDTSFVIPSGVSLYGGFFGVETERGQRDWERYETILSGDLLENDAGTPRYDNPLRQDNTRELIIVKDPSEVVRIDGFSISGAHLENGLFLRCCGSAIRFRNGHSYPAQLFVVNSNITGNVSPTAAVYVSGSFLQSDYSFVLSHSKVENNWAERSAAIYVSRSRILIEDAHFSGNEANETSVLYSDYGLVFISNASFVENTTGSGGVVSVRGEDSGLMSIWSSSFIGNQATDFGPGAINLNGSHLVSVNTIFNGNSTPSDGGALDLSFYTAQIVNNVFAYNTAGRSGGALFSLDEQSTNISNTIFWHNSSPVGSAIFSQAGDTIRVYNSISPGGAGNDAVDEGAFWDLDPNFVDPDGRDDISGNLDDDFRLQSGSPAIDSGDNSRLPSDILDLDGDGDVFELLPGDFLRNERIFDGGSGSAVVDLGVFEYDAPLLGTSVIDEIQVELPSPATLHIYPYPARDMIFVKWLGPARNVDLVLYDMLGRRVLSLKEGLVYSGSVLDVNLSTISPGFYFILDKISGLKAPVIRIQ